MSTFTVTLLSDGKAIEPGYGLMSMQVYSEVNRIPYAELVLIDGEVAKQKFAISDTASFEPGKVIEIKVRYESSPNSEKTIFKGLVVQQEVNVEPGSSTLTVILKDAAVAMTYGKHHRVFNNATDAAIIKKIVGLHHEISVNTIAETKPEHKEMMQYGCSDWDFIVTRAESNGLLLTLMGGVLSAQNIASPSGSKLALNRPDITIDYGIDQIDSINIKANGEGQYQEVSGMAWDFINQSNIAIRKSGELGVHPGNLKSASLASKIGTETYTLATSASLANKELETWAAGKLARTQLSLIRGCIAIPGRGDLKLLDTLAIKGIGKHFNGKALITGIGHRVTAGSWITDIQFGLSDEELLPKNEVNSLPASGLLPAIYGLQIGVVKEIGEDPNKELKIKVSLPVFVKEETYIIWARLASPDAGKERGFYFRPEIGDEVVVSFVNGDPRQAIILGSLYSPKKNPSPKRFGKPDAKNSHRGIVSKKGMVIGFDDEKTIVYLETPGKNSIKLDDDGKKIELKDQHGNSILMDQNGITLKSAKDFNLEASGNLVLKGAKVDIK